MTEAEWLQCSDPEHILPFLRDRISDRKLRLFACACCRRQWPLIKDERLRAAIEVAERFADGQVRVRELLTARDVADQAEYDASYQEYVAEADAHFCVTAEYAWAAATAHASSAARAAVSRKAAFPDRRQFRGGKPGRVTRRKDGVTSSTFCARAVGEAACASYYEKAGFHDPGVEYPTPPPDEWSERAHHVIGPAGEASKLSVQGERAHHVIGPAGEASKLSVQGERAIQALLLRDLTGNIVHPVALEPGLPGHEVIALTQRAYEHRVLPSGQLDSDRLAVLADALEDVGCTEDAILSHLRSLGPHVRGCWALDLILSKDC
jgi:hypothetical protein